MTTRDQAIRLATDALQDTDYPNAEPDATAAVIVDALIDAGLIPDREPSDPPPPTWNYAAEMYT